jgi:DNA adenine methylase
MEAKKVNLKVSVDELKKLTKQELFSMCQAKGFSPSKSLTKAELVDMFQQSAASVSAHRLKPIIKWSGGKSDEIKMFESYFPADYDTYIEPFVGGGSVYFYLNPNKAVINDIHPELIAFYRAIGNKKMSDIYEFMANNPNDEETYYKVRDEMSINEELDSAKQFYYQRKTCFRGMLRYNKQGKFNIPFGRYKSINYEDLKNKAYEELLSRTEILNEGFEKLFDKYDDENNFMFLDPPYDSKFTDYGYCEFAKKEQERLADCFKKTKIKCLMIIGKTKFIEDLYKDFIVGEYDKKYKFKLYDNRVGNEINTKHLIIKNY